MAIALLFFCSLLLATSLGQYGNDRTLNQVFGGVADVVNQGVEVAQEKTRLTTQLTSSAVEHGTNLGKMGVAAGTTLTSKGLGGVSDIGKQGLDLADTVVEILPGGEFVPTSYVTGAGKTALTVVNNIGQKGIKSTNSLGSEVLDKTKTITKITTGTVDNLSSAGTAITKETVSTAANAVANLLNTGVDAFRAFMPGGSTETNEILDIPEVNPKQPKIAEPIPENKIAEEVPPPPVVKPESEPNAIEPVPGPELESNGIISYISSGWSYLGG
uniref:Putative hemolysin-like secreted salivary protein 3 n=1 Tax=Triatoma infestans TaxID=30076 RepID=A0A023FCP8_TRIIF